MDDLCPTNLIPDLRASIYAKLERLLTRPLIATIAVDAVAATEPDDGVPAAFRALSAAPLASERTRPSWQENPQEGTWTVRIEIDYEDRWRGAEKEVLETLKSGIESPVTFLTDAQRALLERSPRELLELRPPPETAELIGYETKNVGGALRVVALTVTAPPTERAGSPHLAIVPNLIPLQRQLDALHQVEMSTDDGPLAPLRALVGACPMPPQPVEERDRTPMSLVEGEKLDEHQRACVEKALATPHFAVIQGPPGSGKTTVIAAILRRALTRGERALVVSPTHVAVDNVVEKLVTTKNDDLAPLTLPVRYAAKTGKLLKSASGYWVGPKKQNRLSEVGTRVQARLASGIPFAPSLFEACDPAAGHGPLTTAIAANEPVICGTPLGILSYDSVKQAKNASFDLLVVDEVSKMTLPEFLAIAVKARRWVVVGDPAQLPPYSDCEENAVTLDDLMSPTIELACTVGATLERARPEERRDVRIVVVTSDPDNAVEAIRAQLARVFEGEVPSVGGVDDELTSPILVCRMDALERAVALLADGSTRLVRILVERGMHLSRPVWGSGKVLIEPRKRAQAAIFEGTFTAYHTLPWARRTAHRLPAAGFRHGLQKLLPSEPAALEAIARRYAVNAVSLYDWLAGLPTSGHDVSPLRELGALSFPGLRAAVAPYVGTLAKQYRMHSSLSKVPRGLFYFDEALLDGRADDGPGNRAVLHHVAARGPVTEENPSEVEAICRQIVDLNSDEKARGERPALMIITPYRKQEALLHVAIDKLRRAEETRDIDVEVCTLDRCQGREADYVLISLVRGRASAFLDMPKRWNVALTRARLGLFIVGDIEAYRGEAMRARRDLNPHQAHGARRAPVGEKRPRMSLLARIIEAYDRQASPANLSGLAGGVR